MRSDRALRTCLQGLVALNLVFVHMTGAAGLRWLVPLFVLTLAAPLLERFRENPVYRGLWNAGVLALFLVLLEHARHAQLAWVLEDGLVLAGLCQVHLLNNLRPAQRPDLLFLNAFLIAAITGFLSRDVGFAACFLGFVACFVCGLQLQNATIGGRVLGPTVTRRLVLDGLRRAALLLVASLLVFAFWPRDFQRKALLSGRLEFGGTRSGDVEVGFNESLELQRRGRVSSDDRPALRVTLLEGGRSLVDPLWRGATLGATTGGAWSPMRPGARAADEAPDALWRGRRGRLARQTSPAPATARVEVERFAQGTERLFAPLGARSLELAPEHATRPLRPRIDATLDIAETGDVRYTLLLAPETAEPRGGAVRAELPPGLAPYVELPDTARIERARELAASLGEALPADAEQHRLVERLRAHLARSYRYLPPGASDAAGSLDEFLSGARGGHCEFFASALATMLRSLRIPCRVVTGFRGSSWDATGTVFAIGTSDAHAWVEVHDPAAGWYAVDPSPALASGGADSGAWARVRAKARSVWQRVTGFDAERRAALAAWASRLPARARDAARARPVTTLLALAALAAPVVLLVLRRRARTPRVLRAYGRAVRRSTLRPQPGETPRELLARARRASLSPSRLADLEGATRAHEAERYAA